MTLQEFVERLPASAAAFQAATQEQHDGDPVGFRLDREEVDWFRELAAWAQFVESTEALDRRGINWRKDLRR